MGVLFLATPFVDRLNVEWHSESLQRLAGRGGPLIAGAAFAIAWTPCTSITLGAILTQAAVSSSAAHAALLLAFGRTGFIGQYLDSWFGLTIPFTPLAVVMAETFVAMPFLIITVEGALRSADQGFEEAAATLGAKRMTVFRRVTLPNIKWGLLYGVILCNARAMGEFGAVSVVSGHIRGETNTLPLHVEILYNGYHFAAAFAVASLLALLALLTLLLKQVVAWRADRNGVVS